MHCKSLCLFCLVLLPFLAHAEEARTLAVLDFENNSLTKVTEMAPLSKGLPTIMITEFQKLPQFKMVERAQLQKILDEMKLGQSGLLDEQSVQQVGKLLGARDLLLGSYMLMLDGKLRLDVRIVEVETSVTLKAIEETGSPKDLSKMISRLVARIAQNLSVQLSKADVKALANAENIAFDAALLYAQGVDYEDHKDFKQAKKMYEKALKISPGFANAQARLKALEK
jgi:TolB-like protein